MKDRQTLLATLHQEGRAVLVSESPRETELIGEAVGRVAPAGTVVALEGPLGAGKTLFVRGIARGLSVPDLSVVTSPTFVLLQEYTGGRMPLFHFDCYRLKRAEELLDLGFEEYVAQGICAIEWADRVRAILPDDVLWIVLEHGGPEQRRILIRPTGPKSQQMICGALEQVGQVSG